ncbi:unnamed protein product [Fusarium equiseti]|uniref:Glycosyl hydrolase family 13 catalytic domain-containing protein n=1 Tax=Fusarium equiseti TaxID=61235 RepID=A0A8J2ITZ4_FUSEQ|nr:unnamed protein product [Fusarium equiseti]
MTVNKRSKQWWKQATIYQIYPASFCDSNSDGIGDLQGIISKLDYIASLGIDVIWICPMYDSPQVDMGYDISNYEDVYAPYGTLQDMEELIRKTHEKGMKIMLDLVINHTSDKHAWFEESRVSKESPKRDWYIWRPAKYSPSGERLPPNNWRSNFGGGSVWEWDEATGEYYLHLFAKEQPDLNWENPETRKAIYASSMEFWLDRGVDGFRVDTVNMYSKIQDFPDAPITDPKAKYQPAGLLYCNGPRMHEFLSEMSEILERYGAITVGELPHTPDLDRVLRYVSAKEKQLNMVFQFDVVDVGFGKTHKYETVPKNYTLPQLKDAFGRTQSLIHGTDAWATVFMENHDQARSVSRFTDDRPEFRVAGAKMLALLQACLSGTQYVYQGQEIGSVNAPKESYPLENYVDIESYQFLDIVKERSGEDEKEIDKAFNALQHLARDHARIPICWSDDKFGGFSSSPDKEPWMQTHPLSSEINVASQIADPHSVLSFWKKALRFRKAFSDLMVYGDYKVLREDDPDIYAFVKESPVDGSKVAVLLNFTPENKTWGVEKFNLEGKLVPIMSTHSGKAGEVLEPFEGRVYLVT